MTRSKQPPTVPAAIDDPRWHSVVRRDPSADGLFFYSVRTTGVYCRPSCAARQPRPENVAFHATRAEAEHAGFRPCKRCKPNECDPSSRQHQRVAAMCRFIEGSEKPLALEQLARKVGLSPFHAHRLFKLATGVTPRGYFNAWRGERLRRELLGSSSVTEAIYGAGFNSSGRFYAEAPARLGMTPSRFRAGGAAERIRFALGECSLGSILVAASERGVCAIALADQPEPLLRELEQQFAQAELIGGDRAFERLVAQVVGLVEQPWRVSELPLDIRGTAFQERVWRALRRVGPGTTLTYGELAKRIGAPTAVRAVARACASNRVAVAIPCHRVVRADGALSGYRWGVERKRQLLQREAARTRPSTTEVTAPQKPME
ncbi:MAG TPA: bifunctional DNA-binding transcriptional regulator/O6-methylguanine-DNA methyltransferase Ada [Polyangiaceae bacterium]|nr:bifunctional DNA-binding transcriptional regulator/O6-methylguanine-DNA methyltransferase Ada [Polyangiaceae bacterium]